MPRRAAALILFAGLGLAGAAQGALAEGGAWQVLFEEGQIVAYEKELPGRDLPVYRARGVIDENVYDILAVFNDFSRHREWMRYMSESRILERPDDFHMTIYVRFDAPWPVWDRDGVMQVHVEFDRQNQVVELFFDRYETPQMPVIDGVIRIPRGSMYARLRYLGAARTAVDCWMDLDPAGSLPRWLVRWFSERVPLQALQRLEDQIVKTKGEYKDFVRKFDPQAG